MPPDPPQAGVSPFWTLRNEIGFGGLGSTEQDATSSGKDKITPLEQYERKVSQSDLWAPEAGGGGGWTLRYAGGARGGLGFLGLGGKKGLRTWTSGS